MKTVYPGDSFQHVRYSRGELHESGAPAVPADRMTLDESLTEFLEGESPPSEPSGVDSEPRAHDAGNAARFEQLEAAAVDSTVKASCAGQKWHASSTLAFVFCTCLLLWSGLVLAGYVLLPL